MLKLTTQTGNEIWTAKSVAELNEFINPNIAEAMLERHSVSFIGREFDSFNDLKTATESLWEEGVMQLEAYIERLSKEAIPEIKSMKAKRTFNSEDGELDFERMMAGNPEMFMKVVQEHSDAPPEVTVIIDCTAHCGVDSMDILWRGAAAIALVKILEEKGYRTEIWATAGSSIYEEHYNRGVVVATNLKRPGEPLDIATLINTVSGWFFRTETFGMFGTICEREGKTLKSNLGRPYSLTEKELDLVTVDQKRIYSTGVFSFHGALSLILNEVKKIADAE